MAGYIRLSDKRLSAHSDPKKRAKIVRAKLREQLPKRLTQAQRLLLDTMVPLALKLDEMAQHVAEPDFDMTLYLKLQTAFRRSYEHIAPTGERVRTKSGLFASSLDIESATDLKDILGR